MRVGGEWQWSAPQVPTTATFRFQGRVHGGYLNGSSWWVQGFGGFPWVLNSPSSVTRDGGGKAMFSVQVIGSTPFSYQWFRNGTLLNDGGNVSGATTGTLILTALRCGDNGNYTVVVSNYSGTVTSLVASLTVRDPFIVSHPRSTAVEWGSNATFTVTAAGTPPYGYQWRKAGVPISGAAASALTLTNLQPADAVGYDVVVSGACGSMTSIVAHLNQELAAANHGVLGIVPLADGRIVSGGGFNALGGLSRVGFSRMLANGWVDASLNLAANGVVCCFVPQSDGRLVVGGWFTSLGGRSRNRLARLNPDGSVDANFNPNANGDVNCLALQADGKIVAGGDFTQVGGLSRSRLARLNPDGSVDMNFNPGANDSVSPTFYTGSAV